MKKIFSLVAVLMIAIFALPFGNTANADTSKVVPDKVSKIDYVVKHETEDKDSSANSFFKKPANILYKDGEKYVQLTVTSWSMIDSLQTGNGEVLVVKENGDNSALIQFKADSNVITLNMHITVPNMYSQEHDARLILNINSENETEIGNNELIATDGGNGPSPEEQVEPEPEPEQPEVPKDPETVEPEQPGEPEKPEQEKPQEGSNQSVIALENGSYTMNVAYLKDKNDEASSMARYMDASVFLTVKDGKVKLTITVNEDKTVTKLQVDGKDAEEKVVDGDNRYETFVFDSLESILNAYVEYQAPYNGSIHYGKADFRISFDEDSIQKANASDKPGGDLIDDPVEDPKPDPSEKPSENPKPNPTEKPSENPKPEQKQDLLAPDKAYEIDYIINHEDGSKPSISNEFFIKPAKLFEKDGKKYLQMKIKNGDMIKNLSNKFGEALVVEKNKDGSIVVQLRVDNNLADMLLQMHIVVPKGAIPGFPGYDEDHGAILVFYKDSMKEVDASKFSLVAGSKDNANGPIIKGSKPGKTVGPNNDGNNNNSNNGNGSSNNDKTPVKPIFGTNGDTTDNSVTPGKVDNTNNPKTGDTSNIILFSLLLIGSLIPLAIQYRKKRIA